jgi:uncharacterized membrane protein (UPF0182 family)
VSRGGAAETEAADGGAAADAPAAVTAPGLIVQANAAYDRAVAAQRAGDWAAYGEALEDLGRILEAMAER